MIIDEVKASVKTVFMNLFKDHFLIPGQDASTVWTGSDWTLKTSNWFWLPEVTWIIGPVPLVELVSDLGELVSGLVGLS